MFYRDAREDLARREANDEARVDTAIREYAPEFARRDETPAEDATS